MVSVGASLVAQLVKNLPAMQETRFDSWVRKICWRRDRLPTPVFLGFPGGSGGKESACNERDLGSIPELGRSPREGKGYPLQYSGLGNSMDCIVHGVTKSQTRLRACTRTYTHTHTHCLVKENLKKIIFLLHEVRWKWNSFSCVWLFATLCTIQSMGFSGPEYQSG